MKLFKNRGNRLEYEFLPAAEEIVETPALPFGYVVIWAITALLVIAFVWSYFGKIDIIASATGKIVPEGSVKTIQPASAGVVTGIKVSEGQSVKKGDVLIQLDDSIARSDVKIAEQALIVAKLERDILAKTLAGEDATTAVYAADISESMKQYLAALADAKLSSDEIQRQLLVSSVVGAQQQVNTQQQSKQRAADSIASLRTQEQELKTLLGSASILTESSIRSSLSSTQQQIASLESSLAVYDQQIAQAQTSVVQANEQLSAYDAENRATGYSDIIDDEKHIAELENTLAKAKQVVEQLTIKAPVDGVILTLATKTIGGVVTAAEPVVEIVPKEATLIVEAVVQSKDIGFVETGQPVVIKVDAYSFQRYGYLDGEVKSISPDAISDEKLGLVYKVKVEIKDSKTSKDNTVAIEPGMSVIAEMTTGKRRIVEFFLDPLMTYTDGSLEVR